jgi:hypothetical protein
MKTNSSFSIKRAEIRKRIENGFLSPRSRGMALVITLILLSVTLVMIIALLAVARRERASVGTSADATTARLASDTALAAAQAQVIANLKSTNAALYSYGLLVSTNYVNWNGYQPGIQNPANVNYFYRTDGQPLNGADFLQNVANQQILPRAPVMVSAAEPMGRYYLDLNRNGVYDTNGVVANIDAAGNLVGTIAETGDPEWVGILQNSGTPHSADNKFLSRYAFIALPVGQALDLNYIHNQSYTAALNAANDGYYRNEGIGSWEINLAAFLADLNTNQWPAGAYNYNRAVPPLYAANTGNAFYDAMRLLGWRYGYNYASLGNLASAFNGNNAFLQNTPLDIFPLGPLPVSTTVSTYANLNNYWAGSDNTNRFYSLPGELFDPTKNNNGFTNRLLSAGTTVAANGAQPTYDRYTFYRMLEQLGTDTLPANDGKLNLNYSNAVVRYDNFGGFISASVIPGAETNLVSWTPTNFFCASADMLLKTYTTNWFQSNPSNYLAVYYGIVTNYYYQDSSGRVVTNDPTGFGLTNLPVFGMTNQVPAFGLANIPVAVNGNFVYAPAVNRLLQLAANIYDASDNNFYPHVFRPIFLLTNQTVGAKTYENVYIKGYQEIISVTDANDPQLLGHVSGPFDLNYVLSHYPVNSTLNGINIYGLPWIIGAKKNLPSFNKFYSYNQLQVSRKLQFNRKLQDIGQPYNSSRSADYSTNQMIAVCLTNLAGVTFWNAYSNAYPNGAANYPYSTPNISVYFNDFSRLMLSNANISASAYVNNQFQFYTNFTVWPGSQWNRSLQPGARSSYVNKSSFIGSTSNMTVLPEVALMFDASGNFTGYESPQFNLSINVVPNFPHIILYATNYVQGFILDNGHVIDHVLFDGPNTSGDLAAQLQGPNSPEYVGGQLVSEMWSTNFNTKGVNWGVQNQITVSITDQNVPTGEGKWVKPNNLPNGVQDTPQNEANEFKGFFNSYWYDTANNKYQNTNLVEQAPYTPIKLVTAPVEWAVNDPLVHYLASDLTYPLSGLNANGVIVDNDLTQIKGQPTTLAALVDRYQPWGVSGQLGGTTHPADQGYDANPFNLAYRDPLIYDADDWDFPTNKFPTPGWLGRVHRGTPWQTVYLKATNLLNEVTGTYATGQRTWTLWSGDLNLFDAIHLAPVQDRLLFDVFTTAPNENATRGTLSVNQSHLAAWSALLSGMVAITNMTANYPSLSSTPVLGSVVVNPAGVDQVHSPLWNIFTNINGVRATLANGVFHHVGEILQSPLLTEQSPFIQLTNNVPPSGTVPDNNRRDYDISDEVYEWLPQQMMGLVRLDAQPRYVIYAFGQTLKPAPAGTILSSQYYGLVTNYQVMAESAVRAVVTVQSTVTNLPTGPLTNYTTKVESYNVLPPQ